MGFSRQEYWNGLPFPPPGDLPHPGMEPESPALQLDSLTPSRQGSPFCCMDVCHNLLNWLLIDGYFYWNIPFKGLPWWLRWLGIHLQYRRTGFHPWVMKIPWRREWQSTPVLLPRESYGQRSLGGYSLWGCKELGMTEATEHTDSTHVSNRQLTTSMRAHYMKRWAGWSTSWNQDCQEKYQ